MWSEQVIENIAPLLDAGPTESEREIDFLDVPWNQCDRFVRKCTRSGRFIRVVLPPDERLMHGDVVFQDGARRVVVYVPKSDVMVARPRGIREMGLVALHLGDLHTPACITENEVVFIGNEPAMEVVQTLGVACRREVRRFQPAFSKTGGAGALAHFADPIGAAAQPSVSVTVAPQFQAAHQSMGAVR